MSYSSDESSSSYRYLSDHSSDYLSYQSSDYSSDESVDDRDIYDIITHTLSTIIAETPLINDGPLNKQIESRTETLMWLSFELSDYDNKFDLKWFILMFEELYKAITEIAKFIDKTNENYSKLYDSLPSAYHDRLTIFGDDFGQFLNNARTDLLKQFNEYISRDDWIKIYSAGDTIDKPLPFLDRLIIKT